jgi:hypothetical protein
MVSPQPSTPSAVVILTIVRVSPVFVSNELRNGFVSGTLTTQTSTAAMVSVLAITGRSSRVDQQATYATRP